MYWSVSSWWRTCAYFLIAVSLFSSLMSCFFLDQLSYFFSPSPRATQIALILQQGHDHDGCLTLLLLGARERGGEGGRKGACREEQPNECRCLSVPFSRSITNIDRQGSMKSTLSFKIHGVRSRGRGGQLSSQREAGLLLPAAIATRGCRICGRPVSKLSPKINPGQDIWLPSQRSKLGTRRRREGLARRPPHIVNVGRRALPSPPPRARSLCWFRQGLRMCVV